MQQKFDGLLENETLTFENCMATNVLPRILCAK